MLVVCDKIIQITLHKIRICFWQVGWLFLAPLMIMCTTVIQEFSQYFCNESAGGAVLVI